MDGQFRDYIEMVARLTRETECVTCGRDGTTGNPECPEHYAYEYPEHDASDTLHGLISRAPEGCYAAARVAEKHCSLWAAVHAQDLSRSCGFLRVFLRVSVSPRQKLFSRVAADRSTSEIQSRSASSR